MLSVASSGLGEPGGRRKGWGHSTLFHLLQGSGQATAPHRASAFMAE